MHRNLIELGKVQTTRGKMAIPVTVVLLEDPLNQLPLFLWRQSPQRHG